MRSLFAAVCPPPCLFASSAHTDSCFPLSHHPFKVLSCTAQYLQLQPTAFLESSSTLKLKLRRYRRRGSWLLIDITEPISCIILPCCGGSPTFQLNNPARREQMTLGNHTYIQGRYAPPQFTILLTVYVAESINRTANTRSSLRYSSPPSCT